MRKKASYICQSGAKWINLPSETPAMPFRPDGVINCVCAWPPSCQDELGSVCTNALRLQGAFDTCHAANWRAVFKIRGCISPWGPNRRLLLMGRRTGKNTDMEGGIPSLCGPQRLISSPPNSRNFASTPVIRQNGGKALFFSFEQSCRRVSTAIAIGSGFQL